MPALPTEPESGRVHGLYSDAEPQGWGDPPRHDAAPGLHSECRYPNDLAFTKLQFLQLETPFHEILYYQLVQLFEVAPLQMRYYVCAGSISAACQGWPSRFLRLLFFFFTLPLNGSIRTTK